MKTVNSFADIGCLSVLDYRAQLYDFQGVQKIVTQISAVLVGNIQPFLFNLLADVT